MIIVNWIINRFIVLNKSFVFFLWMLKILMFLDFQLYVLFYYEKLIYFQLLDYCLLICIKNDKENVRNMKIRINLYEKRS